ncbi:Galactinol--sucrose galactosyltransferase [Psidium guajava]|nr:Galactinol--sucrose galactosyltransferase [Psidium guajava]
MRFAHECKNGVLMLHLILRLHDVRVSTTIRNLGT